MPSCHAFPFAFQRVHFEPLGAVKHILLSTCTRKLSVLVPAHHLATFLNLGHGSFAAACMCLHSLGLRALIGFGVLTRGHDAAPPFTSFDGIRPSRTDGNFVIGSAANPDVYLERPCSVRSDSAHCFPSLH
jgi:hypothetical protein